MRPPINNPASAPDVTELTEGVAGGSHQRMVREHTCEFGSTGGWEAGGCDQPATLITDTGYKCCEAHAPRRNGKIEERCRAL